MTTTNKTPVHGELSLVAKLTQSGVRRATLSAIRRAIAVCSAISALRALSSRDDAERLYAVLMR